MKNNHCPPAWVSAFLDKLAPRDLAEEIKGDLYEIFCRDVALKGLRSASRNYALNSIGFLAKSFFWKRQSAHHTHQPLTMLASYFKMARRSLIAYKGNTMMNVLGLAMGIASALVILYVIRYERSFDTFHSHADRIYRLVRVSGPDLGITEKSECRTGVSYPVPDAIKQGVSSLQKITSVQYQGGALIEVPDKSGAITKRFNEERGCALVEPSFFSIFDFKGTNFSWLEGNQNTALEKPFSIVLTRSMGKKYFPEGNAVGMSLKVNKRFDCTITGIIEDLPDNTDFPLAILISYSSMRAIPGNRMNDWIGVDDSHCTFVVPLKGTTTQELEKQIAAVHAANTPKDIHESRHYLLQPLSEVHFDPRFGNFSGRTITRQTLLALSVIAVFLLLTGSINYINLATAQSVTRSKEIGLRKVMGGNRQSLVVQFLTETFLVVSMAGLLALGLAEILLVNLQSLLNIKLHGYNFLDPALLLFLGVIISAVTIFSGIYPALTISRFNPVASLKNKFSTETVGGFSLRKVLVVTQFTITQILVVGTFVVVAQMNYFQNTDMGFNHEAVITVKVPDRDEVKRQSMAGQLRSQVFVSGVSFSYTLPSGLNRSQSYSDIGRMEAETS
ncbi:MAG TPA: ABC transporter permease, partial [Cyclobacteriaceae bacterium]|nr:ABC transporter permease [Cyclobacteriaceae bacterium]